MKIVCSLAMSINGYVARLDGREDFLSGANWKDFLKFSKELNNFVVGRKSYELVKKFFNGRGLVDSEAKYKILISADKNYLAPDGFVVCNSPEQAVAYLSNKVETGLLIGGSGLNTSFANVGLIDEFWLTLDPIIIGEGLNLFNGGFPDIKTEFLDSEQFTEGRLRVKYKVI